MEKTDFLQTLEGDLCKATGKPVEVILTDGSKVEVTPTITEAPVVVDTTYFTKTGSALTSGYTDHRPGKNCGPQEPKYTHKQYQKVRAKKRNVRRKSRR